MATQVKFVSGERRLKNHQKSRSGCYRCKAKRIKCSEGKPQCSSCFKNGSQCVYPDKKSPTPPTQINLIQPNPLGYSLRDMRLLHDFMTISYPHLPLESDEAWLNEVPIIAQQYEFLMHGILALGAAHLHSRTNLDLQETVERHRCLAVQGLNDVEKLRGSDDAGSRLTALLATSYVLAFAASYMGDSLSWFLVLVRACSSLSGQIVCDRLASPLLPWDSRSATAEPHLEVMRRRLRRVEALPLEDIREGLASLDIMDRECRFESFQADLLRTMKAVFENIDKPYEAYCHFVQIWGTFCSMTSTDFAKFCDVTDTTSVALQAHFLALEALLKPWLMTEVKKDNAQRIGLTALPSSATLSASEQPPEPLRWPLRILGKQAKTYQAMIGK